MGVSQACRLVCATTAAFAAMATLSQGAARAKEIAAQLDYGVAAGCPQADDFEAVVAGRLGYNPFQQTARERVIVRIEPAGRALEGRLEWRDAGGGWIGEQTFPSRTGDCGELARAMGFALALQIQMMATTDAQPRPPAVPPPPTEANPPVATVPSPPSVTVTVPPAVDGDQDTNKSGSPSGGSRLFVGAGAAVGLGVASEAVPIGRLLGTIEWSQVAVELAAEVTGSSTTRRADGAGFSQQRFLGSLAGCGVRRPWSACLVARIGEIRVVGQGIDVPATAYGLIVQGGLRLGVTQTLGSRFQVGAHVDGLALVTQGVVTLDSMPVWTTPRVAAVLGIDVSVRFR